MCTLYVIFCQPEVLGGIIISYLPGIGPGSLGVRTPTINEPILSRATNRVISLRRRIISRACAPSRVHSTFTDLCPVSKENQGQTPRRGCRAINLPNWGLEISLQTPTVTRGMIKILALLKKHHVEQIIMKGVALMTPVLY